MRAQPEVPNAFGGTVTQLPLPRRPDTVRFTVRLGPDAAARLVELDRRIQRYLAQDRGYSPADIATRSIVVRRDEHEFLRREARRAGLTMNGFISKILDDPELTID